MRPDWAIYPGGDIVAKGLTDLEHQIRSEEALVVSAAAPRLRFLGLKIKQFTGVKGSFEHALYEAIEARNPKGAHAEYNAMLQRVYSFTQSFRM